MFKIKDGWQADIGIECHVQLKTKSKLFCGCSNDAREADPNTTVCPVCLGLPGTLPVLNKRAVELALRAGLALESEIAADTKFDRKNYFYPDLPKGYQITQYDQPIIGQGEIEIPMKGETFRVRITRAHLEEDAGKLVHPETGDYSLVDLNRAGTPLLEIVSEPDMHTPLEAKAYAQELHARMRYAEISDADLYHGNMRFDLNISVRKEGATIMGTRSETKNLNSFRSVERAAAYEIERQIEILESDGVIVQETRGWDEQRTYSMRSKEEAADYRYFPEPDVPPLVITKQMREHMTKDMPMTVGEIRKQLLEADVSDTQQEALLNQPTLVRLQLAVLEHVQDQADRKRIANWLSGEVVRCVREDSFDWADFRLSAESLAALSQMVGEGKLSSTGAKQVLSKLVTSAESPQAIADTEQLLQVSDTGEIEAMVEKVIADNPKAAEDVQSGELKAIGFLTGQIMKASGGQANPQKVKELLEQKLKNL